MRILLLNHSDQIGGAARAAYRLHTGLRVNGIDSQMLVDARIGDDWSVMGPAGKYERAYRGSVRPTIGRYVNRLMRTDNPALHSVAVLPSQLRARVNGMCADVVHLHWINGDMLSVQDIGRIAKPLVWTLHDMWPFSGAEHYSDDLRWRDGYTASRRPLSERGLDINRWTWARKLRHWTNPIHIVAPSRWMAACARQSYIFRDWPVSMIHNPIDTQAWCPIPRAVARQILGFSEGRPMLLFGAIGGTSDRRKGFDLLCGALNHIASAIPDLQLLVFGQGTPKDAPDIPQAIRFFGHLHDDIALRVLYSAADAMVIPSRQDNLPNTAVEALACGTPLVAFDTSGLPDLIDHRKTGYLAKPFSPEDLGDGIVWTVTESMEGRLSEQARRAAVDRFSVERAVQRYVAVYESARSESGVRV